jgi:hypothetical protein
MEFKDELHYIASIDNIPSIILHGLLSNKKVIERGIVHTSIANPGVNDRRDHIDVPNGLNLHEYVNFYFNARNPMMYYHYCNSDLSKLCVLKINPSVLELENSVICAENASRNPSFYPYPDGFDKLDFDQIYAEFWTHPGDSLQEYIHSGIMCAEVLIPHQVDISYIDGAYVLNSMVETNLRSKGFDREIIIKPKLFFGGRYGG